MGGGVQGGRGELGILASWGMAMDGGDQQRCRGQPTLVKSVHSLLFVRILQLSSALAALANSCKLIFLCSPDLSILFPEHP